MSQTTSVPTNPPNPPKILRIGIIGCGEIAQVSHITTLNNLSHLFQITYLCDVSPSALAHCRLKVSAHTPPATTTSAIDLCASPIVDAVLVCSSTACHCSHAILALRHNKPVLIEKPLALCARDLAAIAAAERQSTARVFVGYMRRYSAAFVDALAELRDLKSQIQYARVRDIIGPNSVFVAQSGTFPRKFNDFLPGVSDDLASSEADVFSQVLEQEYDVPDTPETRRMLSLLGGLGTHDLSAMRELLGMPSKCLSAHLGGPIWTATFEYSRPGSTPPTFPVVYESGINSIPIFDAHIEVYTPEKIVRVNIDTPYVKGLPTTMTVREKGTGPTNQEAFVERVVRTTYEDPYTREFREWWWCAVEGREIKTSVADARRDWEVMRMVMQAGYGKSK